MCVCVCAEPPVFEHQHLRDLRSPAEADRRFVRGRPPLPGSLAQKVSVCVSTFGTCLQKLPQSVFLSVSVCLSFSVSIRQPLPAFTCCVSADFTYKRPPAGLKEKP